MKKTLIFITLTICLILQNAKAEVQWTDSVVANSSVMQPKSMNKNLYSANQVLGSPSVMPDFGISTCAWTPDIYTNKLEWIFLSYKNPMRISQISIAENFNPGAIVKIYLYGEDGKSERLVYGNSNAKPISKVGRMFNIFIPKTDYKVKFVKIELMLENYGDVYQIDAVGISDDKDSVKHKIKLPNLKFVPEPPENLGQMINSPYSELAPIISPDGKKLIFTRDQHPENLGDEGKQDIWISEMDEDGKFKKAINPGEPINTSNNNFALSVLPDGNTLLIGNVYNPNGKLTPGLSFTSKVGDKWTFPTPLKINNYKNLSSDVGYALSSSGKILILSIENTKSFGLKDLFISRIQSDGTWSEPVNLGPAINTADDEISPFLAADETTLYFSTKGRPGYGISDMFVCKVLDSTWTKFSEPVNLGPGINTPGWDAYYTIPAKGDYAYFVSTNNSYGSEDIFKIKLPEELRPKKSLLISGKVLNSKTNLPIEAKISYEILPEGKNAGLAKSNASTGEYKIILPAGYKYGFLAEAPGYISVNENLDVKNLEEYKEIEKNLYLTPIQKGNSIRLNNIFFEFGEYQLLNDSYSELNRILEFMQNNPLIKVQINGYTDNVGLAADNKVLSEKRASAVSDYLIAKGVSKNRILTKGFGSAKPVAKNDTDENRALNRRVEFMILEDK